MAIEFGAGAAGVAAAAWVGKTVFTPILTEMGTDLAERYSARRQRNATRIMHVASEKLGDDLSSHGEVSGRVGMRVLEEGSWCDAPVMAEYFGGILAASRSEDGRNDRGSSWAALVARLSSVDVLMHYLLYDGFRRMLNGTDLNLGLDRDLALAEAFFPWSDPDGGILEAFGDVSDAVVAESITALKRENLIDPKQSFGPREFLSERHEIDAPYSGLVATPSAAGVQLFLWAHGYGSSFLTAFLDSTLAFDSVEDLPSVSHVGAIAVMKREREKRVRAEEHP